MASRKAVFASKRKSCSCNSSSLMTKIRPSSPGTRHIAAGSGVAVGVGVNVGVGGGVGVRVAVGEGVIVCVGEGITAVTGVFVGSEVVTSTDELLVHAATTAIVQNSNIIHLSSFNFTSLSSPISLITRISIETFRRYQ